MFKIDYLCRETSYNRMPAATLNIQRINVAMSRYRNDNIAFLAYQSH